jgi:hypothetical protein
MVPSRVVGTPKGPRRYVATIRDAGGLSSPQADQALAVFRERGWISTMREEVKAVGGNGQALCDPE